MRVWGRGQCFVLTLFVTNIIVFTRCDLFCMYFNALCLLFYVFLNNVCRLQRVQVMRCKILNRTHLLDSFFFVLPELKKERNIKTWYLSES